MFPDYTSGPRSVAFIPAKLRGITANPKVSLSVGLSFDLVGGSIYRMLLTVDELECLGRAALAEAAFYRERMNSQSASSSGSPSVDVSVQLDEANVCPPVKSSSACSGEV